jgi:hypothetical protein
MVIIKNELCIGYFRCIRYFRILEHFIANECACQQKGVGRV